MAHGRFWAYHPARAYAWELRLKDEISPAFAIDEAGSDEARERFLAEYPEEAAEIRRKEDARRERKARRADAGELFAETELEAEDAEGPGS